MFITSFIHLFIFCQGGNLRAYHACCLWSSSHEQVRTYLIKYCDDASMAQRNLFQRTLTWHIKFFFLLYRIFKTYTYIRTLYSTFSWAIQKLFSSIGTSKILSKSVIIALINFFICAECSFTTKFIQHN